MEINQDMAARFAFIRKKVAVKQAEFAEVLGISRPTVAGLEKGYANITERNIKAVCQAYNVNENWLKTGEGEMFNFPVDRIDLTNEDEKELIRMFRRLTLETKKMILTIVRKFMNSSDMDEDIAAEIENNSAVSEQKADLKERKRA
jgi:transcriptional regulator with XRE-family HTH domain